MRLVESLKIPHLSTGDLLRTAIRDETEVGRVHLGVVHLFDVERPAVHPREQQMLDASFTPIEQLLQEAEHFETWSQICLEALGGSRE